MKSIQVAVVGANAEGAPDVLMCTVQCSVAQIRAGDHYEMAKSQAAEQGYSPAIAIDDTDPAWRFFVREPSAADRFFQQALVQLQDCFIEGREAGGADTVNIVSSLMSEALADDELGATPVFICISGDEHGGYWDPSEGFVDGVSFFVGPETAQALSAQGHSVVQVPASILLTSVPDYEALVAAASDAIERGFDEHGFSIAEENAAKVMREELGADAQELPPEFDQVLSAVMLRQVEVERADMARVQGEQA